MRNAWLAVAFFYLAIVLVGVCLLAGVQLRAPSGSLYDTWRLNYEANQNAKKDLRKKMEELRKEVTDNSSNFESLTHCMNFFNADGTYKTEVTDAQLLDQAKAARGQRKDSDEFKGDLWCLVRGRAALIYDLRYGENVGKDLAEDKTALDAEIAANVAQYAALLKDREEFLAFKQMESAWYFKTAVVIPYDLMVLLLVMFMGALGGMVRLLRDYGDPMRRSPEASEYFFIPLIGLVVAIGGYILAKTGLLLLSTAKDEASLSPFMIGLVGIISGLLAKDVIDALARTGKKIVQGESGQSGEEGSDGSPPARPNQSNLTNMAAGRDEPDRAKTRIDDHGVE